MTHNLAIDEPREEVHDQFTSAAPKTLGWATLAADLPPAAVLGRACVHTLARSPAAIAPPQS
jgi:hypothetical protein